MRNEQSLVPELRFPEFEGEWREEALLGLFDIKDGFAFSSTDFVQCSTDSTQVVRITDINNYNSNTDKVYIPNSKASDMKLSRYQAKAGDLLLSLTGAAGFNFYIWQGDDAFLNQRTAKIEPKEEENRPLVRLVEPLIHKKINTRGEGQNNNLSRGFLATISFLIPEPPEQQKIADCLGSLDELIAAHSRKLTALQDHKKGLLQQLFPADGETTPKLRFPEFENAGEWKEFAIGQLGKVCMCKRIMKHETAEKGDIPFFKIGTFGKAPDVYISRILFDEYTKKYSYPKIGDILISAAGTIGRCVVFDGEDAYFQDSNIVWIANEEKIVSNSFLFYLYSNVKWTTDDNTIPRLYNENLREYKDPSTGTARTTKNRRLSQRPRRPHHRPNRANNRPKRTQKGSHAEAFSFGNGVRI